MGSLSAHYPAAKKRSLPPISSSDLPLSFLDSVNDGSDLDRAEPPAGIASTLFDYQLQALRFMLDRERLDAIGAGWMARLAQWEFGCFFAVMHDLSDRMERRQA